VPDSKGSPSCFGRIMPGDIDSCNWVGHTASLDGVAKKKTHSCQETCLTSNVRQLAGSGIKESYKVQNELKCQSFVIGNSTPTVWVEGATFVRTLLLKPIHISASIPQSSSYLWFTLRVKYHQKTLNFSCFHCIY